MRSSDSFCRPHSLRDSLTCQERGARVRARIEGKRGEREKMASEGKRGGEREKMASEGKRGGGRERRGSEG